MLTILGILILEHLVYTLVSGDTIGRNIKHTLFYNEFTYFVLTLHLVLQVLEVLTYCSTKNSVALNLWVNLKFRIDVLQEYSHSKQYRNYWNLVHFRILNYRYANSWLLLIGALVSLNLLNFLVLHCLNPLVEIIKILKVKLWVYWQVLLIIYLAM
jgi:hypothetical protein